MARALELQLADIEERFSNLSNISEERAAAFKEVSTKLNDFHEKLDTTHNWLQSKIDDLHSSDLNSINVEEASQQLTTIATEKQKKEQDIAQLKATAKELKEDPRTGSPAAVNAALSDLERAASEFDGALREKEADIAERERQGNEYDSAKTLMLLWLAQMEARLDEFEPAAIEVDIVEKQISDLQVCPQTV